MTSQPRRHVMVIVGAGASFDSISDPDRRAGAIGSAFERENPSAGFRSKFERLDWRPPMTGQLFGNRSFFQRAIAHYPAAGVLIDARLRSLDPKTNSVEAVLDELSGEASTSASLRRQLASLRFYLREVLWQCGANWEGEIAPAQTNYHRLVERLVRWQERRASADAPTQVTVVNFNYDVMLDRAIEAHARLDLSNVDGHVARDDFLYFKPHGSVNWARATRLRPDNTRARVGDANERLLLWSDLVINAAGSAEDGIPAPGGWHVIGDWSDMTVHEGERDVLGFPALTVPILSKDSFEMPDRQIEILRRRVRTVTHLLVVGWRAREENFLKLWRSTEPESRPVLQVVGTAGGASETTDRLLGLGIPARAVTPVTAGFSSYMGGAYGSSPELYNFVDSPL